MSETKKPFMILALILGIATVVALLPRNNRGHVEAAFVEGIELPVQEQPVQESAAEEVLEVPYLAAEAKNLELLARAAMVKDRNTGTVLLEQNSNTTLPIASLTKLATALVVLGQVSEDDIVTISPEDLQVPQYKAGLVAGEQITVGSLLQAMLIASANDAAMALARHAGGSVSSFVEKMNERASDLAMHNTKFANPVGFDDPAHYSTASDLSILVEEFLNHPELLEITAKKQAEISSVDGLEKHGLRTTNKLLLSNPDVLGLKTGYTTEAKGNLIILTPQYFSILLGSPAREKETEAIIEWVDKNFVWPQT